MTSSISTLCSGPYIQVIKSLGYHLSGCWLHCTGGRFIKVVIKIGLSVLIFNVYKSRD